MNKNCKQCESSFTCTPIFIGGEDIMEKVEICDECCEINKMKAEKELVRNRLKRIWEKTIPAEYRKTREDHAEYQKVWKVHLNAMAWINSGVINEDENRLNYGIEGSHGRCKTRIVSRMARLLIIDNKRVLWTDSEKFQWCCQNQFNDDHRKEASEHLQKMRKTPWLILDDIGSLKSSEIVSDNLYSILKYRTDNELRMIWTSNESTEQMLTGLSENPRMRIISRLVGYTNIITI